MNLNDYVQRPLSFSVAVARGFWLYISSSILAVTLAELSWGASPYFSKLLVDHITLATPNTSENMWIAIWLALGIVGLSSFSVLAYRTSGYLSATWMNLMDKKIYQELFATLSKHNIGFFADNFAGALATKCRNIASGVWTIWEIIQWMAIPIIAQVTISMILITSVNIYLGGIMILWMIIQTSTSIWLGQKKQVLSKASAAAASKRTGQLVDSITNMHAVTMFARGTFEQKRLGHSLEEHFLASKASWSYTEFMQLMNNVLGISMRTLLLIIAVYLWSSNMATPGDIIMLYTVSGNLNKKFFDIGKNINRLYQSHGELNEGLEVIATTHSIVDNPQSTALNIQQGAISFSNISFSYDDDKQHVFKDFTLNIQPGEKIGLVGVSGAGKTSLVKLFLRMYETDQGTISIDGQNIKTCTLRSLRENIALIPQEASMFHRSIHENIIYGRLDATEDEVKQAAQLAQADEFIQTLNKGYHTLVGERGVKLSGGQRQRIAIARAILKDAPILVLDEATSALDSENEVAIQRALHNLIQEKTVIAIAHRLSTLREMDRIIVLEDGKIIQDGSHEALAAQPGLYATLWKQQSEGFM